MPIRKTKIICTIGPASNSYDTIKKMVQAGLDAARLNFSHGTRENHLVTANLVKQVRDEMQRPVALLMDTKGPEIRIKTFRDGAIELKDGQTFTLTTREVEGTEHEVSVTYADLPKCLQSGSRILLDDGLIGLTAENVTETDIVCRVTNSGALSNRKSINLPGISTNMPYLDEQDKLDLKCAYDNDFDYIALSFVRSAQDVLLVKEYLGSLGPPRCELIAKIENVEGVANRDEIIRETDGIMVARGDLGVEIPFEELPGIQKMLVQHRRKKGDHCHANAGIHDMEPPPDTGGGHRCGKRDLRRNERHHALRRNGSGEIPCREFEDDGQNRRNHRIDHPL
jgi:pyruvate kinase